MDLIFSMNCVVLCSTVALQSEGQHSAAAEETQPGERAGAERQRPALTKSVQGIHTHTCNILMQSIQ